MEGIDKIIWFLVMAGVANMAPVFAAKFWPNWSKPISEKTFGSHKTWRGLICGVGVATLVGGVMGMVAGAGALMGDLMKSFLKRRVGIPPGKSWFPWDQTDWIIGMLIFSWPIVKWSTWQAGVLLVVGLGLHLLVRAIGFFVKINKDII
jgi:CDP-2,3-bis-(O-geranylgeranyl)-sn-glycerol synthase